jgi:hypothetical protein
MIAHKQMARMARPGEMKRIDSDKDGCNGVAVRWVGFHQESRDSFLLAFPTRRLRLVNKR